MNQEKKFEPVELPDHLKEMGKKADWLDDQNDPFSMLKYNIRVPYSSGYPAQTKGWNHSK